MTESSPLKTVRPGRRVRTSVRQSFAVVVPAFNEEENIPDLVRELQTTFERHGLDGEVIIVDDGSTDSTLELARIESTRWKQLRVVSHRRNFGKTEALLTAAAETEAEYLIIFDADLQHSPEEIPRFLDKLGEGSDIVTGRKVGQYQKPVVSRLYNALNRLLFRVPVSDLNSMKAFHRKVLNEVHLRHDWHRFFVVLAHARGFSINEIDITLYPRRAGVAKYSGSGRVVVGLLDLVAVAFFLFFSRKPMLLFGLSGLVLVSLGFLVGGFAIALRLQGMGFRPLLYLVILLETVGFLLFGFGFLAELIAQQRAEIDSLHRNRWSPPKTLNTREDS